MFPSDRIDHSVCGLFSCPRKGFKMAMYRPRDFLVGWHASRLTLPRMCRLTYWSIFAAFSILEAFVAFLLHRIPFYYALKLAFLVWCYMPHTQVRATCIPLLVSVCEGGANSLCSFLEFGGVDSGCAS